MMKKERDSEAEAETRYMCKIINNIITKSHYSNGKKKTHIMYVWIN